ncbi:hypothetical protein [Nostoc favosum]|nr:hypothetical protein [Nostoc favosum]
MAFSTCREKSAGETRENSPIPNYRLAELELEVELRNSDVVYDALHLRALQNFLEVAIVGAFSALNMVETPDKLLSYCDRFWYLTQQNCSVAKVTHWQLVIQSGK